MKVTRFATLARDERKTLPTSLAHKEVALKKTAMKFK